MPSAIITASDSGIGKAAAVALAQQGHDVGITWHTDEDGARPASTATGSPPSSKRPATSSPAQAKAAW